mgnify:CR=1 FL=1
MMLPLVFPSGEMSTQEKTVEKGGEAIEKKKYRVYFKIPHSLDFDIEADSASDAEAKATPADFLEGMGNSVGHKSFVVERIVPLDDDGDEVADVATTTTAHDDVKPPATDNPATSDGESDGEWYYVEYSVVVGLVSKTIKATSLDHAKEIIEMTDIVELINNDDVHVQVHTVQKEGGDCIMSY